MVVLRTATDASCFWCLIRRLRRQRERLRAVPGFRQQPGEVVQRRDGRAIRTAGGTPTPDTQALAGVLAAGRPGDQLTLSVLRDGQELTVKLTLGELPGS
jgi:type II secretory pathway component PulM